MIFISYRTSDSNELVARLTDDLVKEFGEKMVFRDKLRLEGGQNWPEEIERSARNCRVMLVVIGVGWKSARFVTGKYDGFPRLHDKDDWVRREIAIGLRENKTVIPLLLGGANMPDRDWLENYELQELHSKQFISFRSDGGYSQDLRELIILLQRQIPVNLLSQSPFQAERLPEPFIGRDEDARRVEQLLVQHHVVVIRGGVGGIGKSALASKTAHNMRETFPDGVFWLRLGETDEESQILNLMSSLDLGLVATVADVSARAKANILWSRLSNRNALIVLDNVESAEEVRFLIPQGTSCRFLVTTRNRLGLPAAQEVELEVLSITAGTELLRRLAGNAIAASESEVACIIELLGALPLAIHIAAHQIRDLKMTGEQYLQALKSSDRLTLLDASSGTLGLKGSFSLSYEQLPASAKELFHAFGAMEQRSVSCEVLSSALQRPMPATLRDLAQLVRRGLIEPGERERRFVIHPLMADYASQFLTDAQSREIHHRVGDWQLAQVGLWDGDSRQFCHGGDASATEVESAISSYRHYLQANAFAEAHNVVVGMADPMTRMGRHQFVFESIAVLSQHVQLSPWLRIYRSDFVLNANYAGDKSIARGELEELSNATSPEGAGMASDTDRKIASAALICLAKNAYAEHRVDEAEELFSRSSNLKSQIDPPDLKGKAYVLNELARVRLTQGWAVEAALDLHRQALAIQEQLFDNKGTAYTLRRIGTLLLRRLKNPKEALSVLRRAEGAAEKCGSTFVLIDILLEKAEAQRCSKSFAESIETLEQSLRLAQDLNDVRAQMHVLKRTYPVFEDVEFYGRALDAIERALKLREGASFFEPYDAEQLEAAKVRLQCRIDSLRKELREIESKRDELANLVKADSSIPGSTKEIRRELRVVRKREKRIRQRLGEVPARIRIGKVPPSKNDE